MDVGQTPSPPTLVEAAVSATHCGAGCVLGDIVSEFAVYASGAMILGSMLWASFLWAFVAAWCLGIAFQYFTIVPMLKLSPIEGLKAAVKADTLSIIAFQIGMYGWMLIVHLSSVFVVVFATRSSGLLVDDANRHDL